MDKEARRRQSQEMKKEHKTRNLLGIAMLTGIWRGTVFINGVANRKNPNNVINVNIYKNKKSVSKGT